MQKKKGLVPALLFLSLIFFAKPAHPEEIKKFRPTLSIRFMGGLGLVAVGDINKVLGSVNNNETFRYWREHDPKYVVGEIRKLNSWTLDGEAELRIDLTPRIGIGIAASGPSFRRSGESSITYTYPGSHGPQVHTFTYKTQIETSLPVKLNFYYSLNARGRRTIFFNAGIGYYSGKMSIYRNFEMIFPTGGIYVEKVDCKTQAKSSLGFHAGTGMEYAFAKNLDFIIEMRGSFIRIRDFKGVMDWENNWGEKYTILGSLYYFSMWDDNIGARYSGLEVWEKPPDFSFRDLGDIRKGRLDLSGLSLKVGIKVGLF